jgi:hypothetical protein
MVGLLEKVGDHISRGLNGLEAIQDEKASKPFQAGPQAIQHLGAWGRANADRPGWLRDRSTRG